MKFSEIVKSEFPKRAIRVSVGTTQSYMGINCRGLDEMKAEQIKWLDSHKTQHCWWSKEEVHLIYRANEKYDRIVWG